MDVSFHGVKDVTVSPVKGDRVRYQELTVQDRDGTEFVITFYLTDDEPLLVPNDAIKQMFKKMTEVAA